MNFIKKATDLLTKDLTGVYFTPKKVTDIIDKERAKSIIGNPPFKKKKL
jgi:hypothetical protein